MSEYKVVEGKECFKTPGQMRAYLAEKGIECTSKMPAAEPDGNAMGVFVGNELYLMKRESADNSVMLDVNGNAIGPCSFK